MKKYRVNTADDDASSRVGLRDLFRFATRLDHCLLCAGVIFSAIQGALSACSSVIFRHLTDALVIGQLEWDLHSLDFFEFRQLAIRAIYTYVGFGCLVFFIGFLSMCCWHSLAERQAHLLRCEFLAATLRQDAAWFDENETGTLTNQMNEGVERVRDGIGDKLGAMVAYITSFITGMTVAVAFSWKLTLLMMIFTPLFFGPLAIAYKLMSALIPLEHKAFGKAAAVLDEVLNGIKTVIAFNGQEQETQRYEAELRVAASYGQKKGMLTAFGASFLHFCLFITMAMAFWYGTHLVVDGELSPGTLFACFWAVVCGAFAIGQAAPQLAVISTAIGAMGPILKVIDRIPPIDASSSCGKKLKKIEGNILFQNVVFRYPSRPSVPVMKGVTINVRGGTHVAFVGHSGSGKSTLVQLLTRGYLEQGGRITIDGVPIADMNVVSLRNQVGVVSQEPCLFNDTVENNIRLGKEDISQEEIFNVCRTANAHEFIAALPHGYKTFVGNGGVQLSGGQRQRLAIARVLAKNPSILILDEATSALDAESEAHVQKALENAATGRTTISIAHRLCTIKNADCIYVFDGGRVVESGKHEELLARRGVYAKLVEDQEIEKSEHKEGEEVTAFRRASEQHVDLRKMSRRLSRGIASASLDSSLERLHEETADESLPGLREVLRFARPQWSQIIPAIFFSILRGLCFPTFSVLYGRMFKTLTVGSDEEKLHKAFVNALLFVSLGLGIGIATLISGSLFSRVGEILTMRMRVALFGNIVNQDGEYLDKEEHSPGRLAARVAADAPNIRAAIDQRLADVVQAVAAMAGGVGVAFYYGPKMAPVGILTAGSLMLVQGLVAQYLKARGQRDAVKAEEPSRIAMEAIGNYKTVQLLNRQEYFVRRFEEGIHGPHRRALIRGVVQSLSYALSISFLFFNFASAYGYGVHLVRDGVCSPFTVFQVIESLNTAAMSVLAFATFMPELIRARLSAALLFRMLAEKPKIDSSCEGGKQIKLTGEIRLKRVFFAYPNTRAAMTLAGIHLTVPQGSTVALVGQSGCGKSTLFQLLLRFYDPIAGQLMFDGEDQKQLNLRHLRSQMAIVGQELILFNYSIRQNIAYGCKSATQDQIEEAARLANAHDFITKMPMGYSTTVGERGSRLSGGQRQRIAIARAVVGNPKILLLDEATSALDADSERIVQEALEKARKGRTCLIIAHRLSSVQNADVIVYVNGGRIEEMGSHQSLLAQRGKYAALVAKQQLSS